MPVSKAVRGILKVEEVIAHGYAAGVIGFIPNVDEVYVRDTKENDRGEDVPVYMNTILSVPVDSNEVRLFLATINKEFYPGPYRFMTCFKMNIMFPYMVKLFEVTHEEQYIVPLIQILTINDYSPISLYTNSITIVNNDPNSIYRLMSFKTIQLKFKELVRKYLKAMSNNEGRLVVIDRDTRKKVTILTGYEFDRNLYLFLLDLENTYNAEHQYLLYNDPNWFIRFLMTSRIPEEEDLDLQANGMKVKVYKPQEKFGIKFYNESKGSREIYDTMILISKEVIMRKKLKPSLEVSMDMLSIRPKVYNMARFYYDDFKEILNKRDYLTFDKELYKIVQKKIEEAKEKQSQTLSDLRLFQELPVIVPYAHFEHYYGLGNCVVNLLINTYSNANSKSAIARSKIIKYFGESNNGVKYDQLTNFLKKYDVPYEMRNVLGKVIEFNKGKPKRRKLRLIYYNQHIYNYTITGGRTKVKLEYNEMCKKATNTVFNVPTNGKCKKNELAKVFNPYYTRNFFYREEYNIHMVALRLKDTANLSKIDLEKDRIISLDVNSCYTSAIMDEHFASGATKKIPYFGACDLIEQYEGGFKDLVTNCKDEWYVIVPKEFTISTNRLYGYNKNLMHGFMFRYFAEHINFQAESIIEGKYYVKIPKTYLYVKNIKRELLHFLKLDSYDDMKKEDKYKYNYCNGMMGKKNSGKLHKRILMPNDDEEYDKEENLIVSTLEKNTYTWYREEYEIEEYKLVIPSTKSSEHIYKISVKLELEYGCKVDYNLEEKTYTIYNEDKEILKKLFKREPEGPLKRKKRFLTIKEETTFNYINSLNIYNYTVDISNFYLCETLDKVRKYHKDNKLKFRLLKLQTDAICFYTDKDTYSFDELLHSVNLPKHLWKNEVSDSLEYLNNKLYKNADQEYKILLFNPFKLYESEITKMMGDRLTVITGKPGTGKTHHMRENVKPDFAISLTNMAANNMGENGETLYKLFSNTCKTKDNKTGKVINVNTSIIPKIKKKFQDKKVWIDEFSMLDTHCYKYIIMLLEVGATVYLTGDINQCDPIMHKNDYDSQFFKILFKNKTEFVRNYRCDVFINYLADNIIRGVYPDFKQYYKNQEIEERCKIRYHIAGRNVYRRLINYQIVSTLKNCFVPLSKKTEFAYKGKKKILSKGIRLCVKEPLSYLPRNKILEAEEDVYYTDEPLTGEDIPKMKLTDGKLVYTMAITKLCKFKLGYSVTVHSIQGSTIDEPTMIYNPEFLFEWDKKILYTAVTRLKDVSHLSFCDKHLDPSLYYKIKSGGLIPDYYYECSEGGYIADKINTKDEYKIELSYRKKNNTFVTL